jgi:hypothetical protein
MNSQWTAVLPLVVPTGAQGSRGICRSADLRPTQGMKNCFYSFLCPFLTEVSSRPERTRISCHAALDMTTCAPFRKEGRMKCTNATKFHRKSGVAKWRDLLFMIRSIESEWKRYPPLCHPDRSVPGFPATLHRT